MTQTNSLLNAFVYIIESPSDLDLLNGQNEGQALTATLNLCKIPSIYNLVCNKNTFKESLLNRVVNARNTYELLPILHFSMHGSEDGIGFTDGDFISWHELRELLIQVNRKLNFLPLICFSSCYGISSLMMEYNNQSTSSFYAILGHRGELSWSNSAVAYITFYNRFFQGSSIDEAFEAMKAATGDDNFNFFRAENIKKAYISESINPRQLNSRVVLMGDFQ